MCVFIFLILIFANGLHIYCQVVIRGKKNYKVNYAFIPYLNSKGCLSHA